MRITEMMPAGRIIQVFAGVRSRIYPRSQTVPRLAAFGEDYAPSPPWREQQRNSAREIKLKCREKGFEPLSVFPGEFLPMLLQIPSPYGNRTLSPAICYYL